MINYYNIFKVADMPIQEKHDYGYLDIGHKMYDPNKKEYPKKENTILWFITDTLQFFQSDTEKEHVGWNKYDKLEDKVIASGRFEPQNDLCSLAMDISKLSIQRQEYVIKKIESILDKVFNYPKIAIV